jgi:hypothetical protein
MSALDDALTLIREAVTDPALSDGAFRALVLKLMAQETPDAADLAWARHLLKKRTAEEGD